MLISRTVEKVYADDDTDDTSVAFRGSENISRHPRMSLDWTGNLHLVSGEKKGMRGGGGLGDCSADTHIRDRAIICHDNIQSTSIHMRRQLEPILISVLGQKQSALVLVQAIDDSKLVAHRILCRCHTLDTRIKLLEGAQHELECFGRSD